MSKIERLTDAQIARFPEFIQKWTAIGLCEQPADRIYAEKSLRLAYEITGKPVPRIVWTTSPLVSALVRGILQDKKVKIGASVGASVWASVWASVGDSVRASVGASVRDSVGDSVRASVRASVGDSVWASVGDSVRASVGASVRASVGASVWASVRDSVGDSVWASVGDSVRASVGASVRDSVGDSVRDSVGDSGYGQHDANWIGFYDFFEEVCGLSQQTKRLAGLKGLTEYAGWYLPHANICWISERTTRARIDDRNRLHSHDGMAWQYHDGWGAWYWHGVKVNEQIILQPNSLTSEQILHEPNAEVRRVMIERLGLDRFLSQAKATPIHTDDRRALYKINVKDDEPIVAVQVQCPSTGQIYFLRVPPQIDRCDKAVAWSFGFQEVTEYQPAIET